MINIEIIAKAVASAIHHSRKFRAAEQSVALALIAKASTPEDIAENMGYIGNISAISQRLQKAGVLPMAPQELDAFQRNVKAALDVLDHPKAK